MPRRSSSMKLFILQDESIDHSLNNIAGVGEKGAAFKYLGRKIIYHSLERQK